MCDMTHSYVWHDSFLCATWLIRVCHTTHPYVWYDSLMRNVPITIRSPGCVTWLMTHIYVWHDGFMCVTWLVPFECTASQVGQETAWQDLTDQSVRHDSFLCATWLISMCDMTHFYVRHDWFLLWHDSFLCVTWLDVSKCETWLIPIWDITVRQSGEHDSVAEMIAMWLFLCGNNCYVALLLQKLLVCGEHDSVLLRKWLLCGSSFAEMIVMWLFCCGNYCYVALLLRKLSVCGEHDSILLRKWLLCGSSFADIIGMWRTWRCSFADMTDMWLCFWRKWLVCGEHDSVFLRKRLLCGSSDWYRIAKTHKMPWIYRSFSAKEPYDYWLFCGNDCNVALVTILDGEDPQDALNL